MKMKYLSIVILSAIMGTACQSQKKVSISINYLQPYCGGARPTEEMEADAQTPKPLKNTALVLLDAAKKAKTVKTDEQGKLNLHLKPGHYELMEVWRHKKTTPNGSEISLFDKNCLLEEWKAILQTIDISKSDVKTEEKYMIIQYCDHSIPCMLDSFKPPMRE